MAEANLGEVVVAVGRGRQLIVDRVLHPVEGKHGRDALRGGNGAAVIGRALAEVKAAPAVNKGAEQQGGGAEVFVVGLVVAEEDTIVKGIFHRGGGVAVEQLSGEHIALGAGVLGIADAVVVGISLGGRGLYGVGRDRDAAECVDLRVGDASGGQICAHKGRDVGLCLFHGETLIQLVLADGTEIVEQLGAAGNGEFGVCRTGRSAIEPIGVYAHAVEQHCEIDHAEFAAVIDGCANARAGSGGFQNVPAVLGQL